MGNGLHSYAGGPTACFLLNPGSLSRIDELVQTTNRILAFSECVKQDLTDKGKRLLDGWVSPSTDIESNIQAPSVSVNADNLS